jgi:hypothetical protein
VTELVLNRTRRNVLSAVDHGRVTLNDAGHPFLRIRNRRPRLLRPVRRHWHPPGRHVVTEPGMPTPLPNLAGVRLDTLRRLDLDDDTEQVVQQVQRPRVNLGGSSPPGRAD